MSRTVLIIDNDDTLCQNIQAVLMADGYEVYVAYDGASALNIIPLHPPDLIFLAAQMQGMDGLAFLRYYEQLPGSYAPVIVMSAKDDTLSRALVLHSQGFLAKPFARDKLVKLTRQFLH